MTLVGHLLEHAPASLRPELLRTLRLPARIVFEENGNGASRRRRRDHDDEFLARQRLTSRCLYCAGYHREDVLLAEARETFRRHRVAEHYGFEERARGQGCSR